MLVLFDHGTPRTLARHLIDRHMVTEARARGWERAGNGELLTLAEAAGFEVIVVLGKCQWGLIKARIPQVVAAVNAATPGSFTEVAIPFRD